VLKRSRRQHCVFEMARQASTRRSAHSIPAGVLGASG
jgi:hypothetical protein